MGGRGACHGKKLDHELRADAILLGIFVSWAGSYVGLTMLKWARKAVMEEHQAGYFFFVLASGLCVGAVGVSAMHIIEIQALKLLDCADHEVHEDFEIKLTFGSFLLGFLGLSYAMHQSLFAIKDVREGKTTDSTQSGMKVGGSKEGFSSQMLVKDGKENKRHKITVRGIDIECERIDKKYYANAVAFLSITLMLVLYMGLLAQVGPFSIHYDLGELFVTLLVSIFAAASVVLVAILAATKRADTDLDAKIRFFASLWVSGCLNLLHHISMLKNEYTYYGHRYRSFTAHWNTLHLPVSPGDVSIGALAIVIAVLSAAQHYGAQLLQGLQRTHDKMTKKLPDDVEGILTDVFNKVKDQDAGEIASYIPELANANPEHFAIALCDCDGQIYKVGDVKEYCTIQSVSKALLYVMAMIDSGRGTTDRKIGEEPSGRPFNECAIDDENRAYNALINTGALVSSSLIKGSTAEFRYRRFQTLVKKCSHTPTGIKLDHKVYTSEMATNQSNRAIVDELEQRGIIEELAEEPDEEVAFKTPGEIALDAYTKACSLSINVVDIAVMAATFANDGANPINGQRVMPKKCARHVVTVMMSCGMYNGAGKWIVDVGIPAKSGVGGLLMCVCPGICGIGIFSPKLDEHGNSTRGVLVAEALSRELDLHVLRKGGGNDGSEHFNSIQLDMSKSAHNAASKPIDFSKHKHTSKVIPE